MKNLLTLSTLMFISMAFANQSSHSSRAPSQGYVPNEETAIRVSEAILVPIYGREQIESEKPFHAKLESGVWRVEGTLPAGTEGGVATVRLSQKDAHIISVSHGK
jgi:hypothetical protein